MQRNSSIIGPQQLTSSENSNGIFDSFDHYNARLNNNWPTTSPSIRIELSGTTFDEGDTLTATIYITGIDSGESLSWAIKLVSGNSLNATDFDNRTGSFTVPGNYVYSLQIEILEDLLTEGTEVFNIEVSYQSQVLATSSNFTVNDTSTGDPEPAALYDFTSFTFTNGTTTGRTGPTLANLLSSYDTVTNDWLTNTDFFNVVTQGYQLWTVPTDGDYEVTVIGAVGGTGINPSTTGAAGRGARMVSTLSLTKGNKLQIIVGQQGGNGSGSCGFDGGGGGGSFVFTEGGTCLMAAGGGGGGSNNTFNRDVTRRDAPDSTSGNRGSGTTGGLGGASGNGGSAQSGSCVTGGGAGAGILTNGASDSGGGGQTYSNGFLGGTSHANGLGGFGGGGGAGTAYAGGGGGGYSGGGGGGLQTCACNDMGNGGGGGSFSTTSYTYTANIGTAHGSVTITKL